MVYGGCFHFSFLNNFVWIQQIDCKYWYLQFCSNSKTDVDCEIVFMTANYIFTILSCTRNGRPFWVPLLINHFYVSIAFWSSIQPWPGPNIGTGESRVVINKQTTVKCVQTVNLVIWNHVNKCIPYFRRTCLITKLS